MNFSFEVWISQESLSRWPYLAVSIRNSGVSWRPISIGTSDELLRRELALRSTVLSICESNLGPHRLGRRIVGLANKCGLYTATMQHGFENVGLTYSDDTHSISNIEILSRTIFVWGPLGVLHPQIPDVVRRRCHPVGFPKTRTRPISLGDRRAGAKNTKIGIFENLHWHRYDEIFRQKFMSDLKRVVKSNPDIEFMVKPHDAGQWLAKNNDFGLNELTNLTLVDSGTNYAMAKSTGDLIATLAGVITTPSTIAVDSTINKCPTAVVSYGLELTKYEPLFRCDHYENWIDFIQKTQTDDGINSLLALGDEFLTREIHPGDSSLSILRFLIENGG